MCIHGHDSEVCQIRRSCSTIGRMTSAAVRGRTSTAKKEKPTQPVTSTVAMARFFKVLSDPTRLAILELLLKRDHSVGELVELLQVPQSRVSNHLACLRWCRFVTVERESRHGFYRVSDPDKLRRLMSMAAIAASDNCDHLSSCSRIGPDWI